MDKINTDVLAQNNLDYLLDTSNICEDSLVLFKNTDLLKFKENRRQKLYEKYNAQYNLCINNIKKINLQNKTDILFTIPTKLSDCADYNSSNCIDFIEYKLNQQKFDVLKIGNNKLFISWAYLELYV